MSEQSDVSPVHRPSWTLALLAVGLAVGAALTLTAAASGVVAAQEPLPGGLAADGLTSLGAMLGQVVAVFAGAATLGLLGTVVFFAPPLSVDSPVGPDERLRRWTVRSAQVWFAASFFMTFANPAFVEGVPLGAAIRPDAWWIFATSTVSDLAWIATALVALGTVITARLARTTSALALCWMAGASAAIFVSVTGGISVGRNHDWGTDAVSLATVAFVTLVSLAVGVGVVIASGGPSIHAAMRRYHRSAPVLLVLVAAGYAVGAWQQLAGTSPFDTPYGLPVILGCVIWGLLVLSWLWRQLAEGTPDATWRRPASSIARDLVLLVIGLTSLSTLAFFFPPRYRVSQTIQVNYLGYEMDAPATIARLVGFGRANLLWIALATVAVGLYVWGVVRVMRGGERWPVGRLLSWVAGWGLAFYIAVSGLWSYSTALFSWHMLVHMTINMMIPVLLVVGAPLTLLSGASRAAPGGLAGADDIVRLIEENRLVRFLQSPAVVWVNYVGSLFVVYFSAVYPWLMKYHWGHQLMLVYFLVAGSSFFAPLIGPDRNPWPLPYIVRFALLISIMPFHAIFAVGIMESRTLLGGQFYNSIAIGWVGDLLKDQNIAGQITWFTGEVPAFIAVIMLAAQWFRSDTGQAEAADELMVGGTADELDAYNEMLAELARREQSMDEER